MIIVGNGRLITRNPDAPFYESGAVAIEGNSIAVSYTHLTLPTTSRV